ncbi:MAG TPA: SRPBCC family protein [Dehalococcoidia bacterium]|nr:SRPBCC family protein [Dehalococcoidia bacterium]
MKRTLALLALGLAGAGYARFGRPRVLNWGATPEEVSSPMPGDDIVPDAWLQTTRAITIEAPPSAIWPWLVQMGPRPRAGAYTYDWIERLLGIDIENSDVILPEFQRLEAGEWLGLNEKGQGLRVVALEAEKYLLVQWEPQKSTWLFALYPQPGGVTRLVSRNRLAPAGLLSRLFTVVFMEAGSLVMERKMLLGVKERAERLWREQQGQAGREAPAAAAEA